MKTNTGGKLSNVMIGVGVAVLYIPIWLAAYEVKWYVNGTFTFMAVYITGAGLIIWGGFRKHDGK